MRFFVLFVFVFCKSLNLFAQPASERLLGHWQGIELYQDENTYDGKVFYLPNKEELVITPDKFKIYFYPYFKSDEFEFIANNKTIVYAINRKKVKCDYSFSHDTLILSMNFINKTFIKKYKPMAMSIDVLTELDTYGFNPNSLKNEYEIDTLHPNLALGYKSLTELNFPTINHIQFLNSKQVNLNREGAENFTRSYQTLNLKVGDKEEVFRILNVNGTQQFTLIPTSQCNCDTIFIPYLVVSWADRIRKKIEEDTY